MDRIVKVSAAFLLVLGLLGCAFPATTCPAGLSLLTKAELFFGRGLAGGGEVSEGEWQHFVDSEITPRFPDGLTIEDAAGQWKGSAGPVRERAKHVVIVLTRDEGAKLAAIRMAYKTRFHQESVLLLQNPGCGSF